MLGVCVCAGCVCVHACVLGGVCVCACAGCVCVLGVCACALGVCVCACAHWVAVCVLREPGEGQSSIQVTSDQEMASRVAST